MRETIDDGGAAFPHSGARAQCYGYDGMSLRDWFAGQAMAAFCSIPVPNVEYEEALQLYEHDAHLAYKVADAMIRARSKP